MIDVNYILQNRADFEARMLKRGLVIVPSPGFAKTIKGNVDDGFVLTDGVTDAFSFDYVAELNDARKAIILKLEGARQEVNQISDQIAAGRRGGKPFDDLPLKERSVELGVVIEKMEREMRVVSGALNKELSRMPNLVDDVVPEGASEDDNVEVRTVGRKREFDFVPREHQDICQELGGLSLAVGAKIAGARTNFMFGEVARLHRALASFMIDMHLKNGFCEVAFPVLTRPSALYGTGQLSSFNFSEDLFHIPNVAREEHGLGEDGCVMGDGCTDVDGLDMVRDLFLIPTGEVPMVNMLSDAIVDAQDLPARFVGYSECFRKEAGAGGRDVKGIIRQKQFGKVEMVVICRPEESESEHQRILAGAESVLQALGLHYRVVLLCAGDMGFSSRRTYDIEVWLPGQQRYREISSCSNTGDFQSRRANIKVRDGKKRFFAHALNGSGLAVGRTLIAVVENYQNADGSVSIPDALLPYMGGLKVLSKQSVGGLFRYMDC